MYVETFGQGNGRVGHLAVCCATHRALREDPRRAGQHGLKDERHAIVVGKEKGQPTYESEP
jgi:hypothetical protein